jgi:hypothetical protein
MPAERKSEKLAFGSFEHADLVRAKRMAALTPAQRVSIACSLDQMSRRVAAARNRAAQHQPESARRR